MDRVKLSIFGVSEIVGLEDVALLGLVDEQKDRQLVVTCDKKMVCLIKKYMTNEPHVGMLFPQVMADVLKAQGCYDLEVWITDVNDGEYKTEVVDGISQKHFPIRCSDGVLFSLVSNAPIYATGKLMMKQSVPFRLGESKIGLPLTILSEQMLQMAMKKAIETENFEMASNLRDELNKRHADKDNM